MRNWIRIFFVVEFIFFRTETNEIVNPLAASTDLYFCWCARVGAVDGGMGTTVWLRIIVRKHSCMTQYNWCAKRALGGSSSSSSSFSSLSMANGDGEYWRGVLRTHESKWGENSFGNWNEYKFYFFSSFSSSSSSTNTHFWLELFFFFFRSIFVCVCAIEIVPFDDSQCRWLLL